MAKVIGLEWAHAQEWDEERSLRSSPTVEMCRGISDQIPWTYLGKDRMKWTKERDHGMKDMEMGQVRSGDPLLPHTIYPWDPIISPTCLFFLNLFI